MSVVLSPVAVREEVSRIIGPLHARRQLNLRESATLAALRDALLPRLISGEIRVPVAEEILEAGL